MGYYKASAGPGSDGGGDGPTTSGGGGGDGGGDAPAQIDPKQATLSSNIS